VITLYTPATGYPELEAKLAYGLARIGLECCEDVTIEPQPAFYRVHIDATEADVNTALITLATRSLAGDHLYLGQPGIQVRYFERYAPAPEDLDGLLGACHGCPEPTRPNLRQNMCGHDDIEPWGGTKGFILVASAYVGMPARRDRAHSKSNLALCALCGTLVMLATHSFVFQTSIGERDAKRAVMTPIPYTVLGAAQLVEMQAAQKLTPERVARNDLPAVTVPDRVVATHFSSVRAISEFVNASPFNAATVEWLLAPRQPVVDPLMQLTRLLTEGDLHARRRLATSFARGYVTGANPENPRLLYPVTVRHIGEEVLMIPGEIMRNDSIHSLASALRHFVQERNYGFVDNVRNARYDSHDLERTLTQMLRQMQVHRAAEKRGAWLPDDAQVAEVVTLASESEDQFEDVKLALTLLALSRWHGRDEEAEEPMEVAGAAEEAEE